LKPLPYPDPDRIVMLWEQPWKGETLGTVTPGNYVDWREQTRSFSDMAAMDPGPNLVLTGQGDAARLTGAAVSSNFFSLLGTRITLGRDFLKNEDRPG
jgi:putative ABC transport system permease protein